MLLRVVIFWGPYDHRWSYGPPKLKGTFELHQDKESIEVNLKMFSLFFQCESFTYVHGYCCRDQAASNVGKIRFTRMANSFVLPRQNWARTTNDNSQFILFGEELSTRKSHLVQKKSKLYFRGNQIVSSESYIHRVKTIFFKWTRHINWHCGPLHWIKKGSRMSFKGRGEFLLQRSSHLC